MFYTEKLRISKGGKLFAELWKNKQRQDVDISNSLYNYLFNICYLEDGLVLKDILLLVKDWCDVLSPITTNSPTWLNDIVNEGLNRPFELTKDGVDIEFLELSWDAELRKYKDGPAEIEQWLSFSGMGNPPKEDPNNWYKDWPAGEKVSYAIDFCSIENLSEIQVKLNNIMKIHDVRNRSLKPNVIVEGSKDFTLIDILRGVFWELSFHGSPTDKAGRLAELNKTLKEIESGECKTKSWDELDLTRDKDETKF